MYKTESITKCNISLTQKLQTSFKTHITVSVMNAALICGSAWVHTYRRGRFLISIRRLTCETHTVVKALLSANPLYFRERHGERRARKTQNRPEKFWNTTGGVRPNQWMQMPSPHQPRVPPWLRMPRMCGTNPQDLVCFPPHLPSATNSSPHLPCLSCCTNFFSTVLNFVSPHLISVFRSICARDLLSINLFSGSRSLLPISRPLIFPTVWLLAPSRPHFACHSLPPTFSPVSSLITPLSLSPRGGFSPCCTPPHPPLFPPSPSLQWYHEHAHVGRVLKFICTSAADSAELFQGSWLWPWKNCATMETR